MDELIAELARRLVDEPAAVSVEQYEDEDGTLVYELIVAEGDVGKVIGRQGRLARALRTIVRAGGVAAGRRLALESVQIGRTLYVHASPRNDVDIFTERTPEERIAFLFEDVDADVVVFGHVHTQYERTVAGKRLINAGSVGMPYEDEPGAYWLLDLE